jgi:malonate-semialdehyde dehydrogenase (acetylating)/methylmalonate-semialdehyde dehydrogenase
MSDTDRPTIDHWLDGKAWPGSSTRTSPVFNPATGRLAMHLAHQAGAGAVRVSRTGGPASGRPGRAGRAGHGKVFSDAMGEVGRGPEVADFACGIPHLLKGGYSEGVSAGVDVYSIRQPVGVVTGITPFNFPAMVPMWMFLVAIACGNAFIPKPSESDPSAPRTT